MTPAGRWTTFALGCSPTRRSRGRASVRCSAARARGDGAPSRAFTSLAAGLRMCPTRRPALPPAARYLFGRGLAYVPDTAPTRRPIEAHSRLVSMTPDDLPPSLRYVPGTTPSELGTIGTWEATGEQQATLTLCGKTYEMHFESARERMLVLTTAPPSPLPTGTRCTSRAQAHPGPSAHSWTARACPTKGN